MFPTSTAIDRSSDDARMLWMKRNTGDRRNAKRSFVRRRMRGPGYIPSPPGHQDSLASRGRDETEADALPRSSRARLPAEGGRARRPAPPDSQEALLGVRRGRPPCRPCVCSSSMTWNGAALTSREMPPHVSFNLVELI